MPTDRSTAGPTRRSFLRTLAATGLAAGAGVRPARAEVAKDVIVGAHPWVYAAKLPKYDITPALDTIFADVAAAGYDGLELMHTALAADEAVDRIKALIHTHELPVLGTSYGDALWDRSQHRRILEEAGGIIGRLAKVGGKTLGTSVGDTPKPKTDAQLDAQAEMVRRLMEMAGEDGITLNLHNHTYEVEDGLHDLKGTLARVPGVKLGPDLNWLVRGGVDPVAFLKEYGDRVVFLHLRDQKADGKWSEALGEGDMDYEGIARALEAIPFSGYAVVELAHERDFTPTRPIRESLRMSREFVRKTLGY